MKRTIKLNVPTKWEDISIKQYQDFMTLFDSDKPERIKVIEGVSIFTKVDIRILKKGFYKDLEKAYSLMVDLNNETKRKLPLQKIIDFKGKKYGLIPNMSEMSTGEFIDMDNLCNEDLNQNMHQLMSVLYRPIVGSVFLGRYEIEEYNPTKEKEEEMLDLPMDVALGVFDFFFHLEKKLLKDSNNYLVELKLSKIKEQKEKGGLILKNDIRKNGGGMQFSMN